MEFNTKASFDAEDKDFGFIGTLPFPGEKTSYDVYRVGEDGDAQWVSRDDGEPLGNELMSAKLTGVSADGSSVFIETPEPLVPGVSTARLNCLEAGDNLISERGCNLYRWRNDHLEYVAVDENGDSLIEGARLGYGATIGPVAIGGHQGDLPDSAAVSSDGKSFVYCGVPQSGLSRQVYLRKPDGTVVRLSTSQRAGSLGEPATQKAAFTAATGDLSAVYFQTQDQLTDDAPVGGGDYRYDVATEQLEYSNPEEQLVYLQRTGGFSRASADGDYVYFVHYRALVPGAFNSPEPQVGSNMYVRTPQGIRLVATIRGDESELAVNATYSSEFTSTGISEDGTKFVFQTAEPNTSTAIPGSRQVYLYDAKADALSCLSCPPPDVASGPAGFGKEADVSAPTPRAMSADGSRIAFTSDAALVPDDTNGVGDVYEYLDGKVHLISSGTSPYRSFFVGMSESGDDLFFMTRESLAASDTDAGQYDVYDAHVDGGFAGPPTMTPPCAEDRCQGAPTQATPPPAIASESPSAGNPTKKKHHHKHKHKKKKHKKAGSQQRAIENRRSHR